ncbi:AAA family ATPase [Massilia sp. CCM 8695]|uniref:AAA family ATPase n=1 Tax=Massilia frigida TaxID=2609281 RepID=A0ABX0NIN5_9BURK|nr:AAA family ATPase [Massilia frigida]NHZ82703.1 AAA family ATPase [Massilia frigida]
MSKESAEGPLQESLKRLSNLEELRSRSSFLPPPELGLHLDTAEVATDRLRIAWSRIYLPHESHLMLMRDMVDRAVRSVETRYPSREQYMKARYSGSPLLAEEQAWCVTGLAGISKSATMTAIYRVFASLEASGGIFRETGIEHKPQLIQHVQIGASTNLNEILSALANPLFLAQHKKAQLRRLKDHLREWLYTQSTLLIVVDELQFLTRSATASTLIANTISALSELGPPVFYTSNYSLGHKLMRRPQEDKDRLLARVTLLDPPSSNDTHWAKVISLYTSFSAQRHFSPGRQFP